MSNPGNPHSIVEGWDCQTFTSRNKWWQMGTKVYERCYKLIPVSDWLFLWGNHISY